MLRIGAHPFPMWPARPTSEYYEYVRLPISCLHAFFVVVHADPYRYESMEPEGASQVLQRFSLYMPRSLTPADLWNLTCFDSMTVLPAPSVLASMTLNMSPSAFMCAFTRLNMLQESRTPYGLYSSLSTLHLTVASFGARLGNGGWLTLTI